MKLSVAVMAHPSRRRLVDRLVERIGVDADRVVWDRRDDMWDTGTRSWQHYDTDADWHMVIQDDAVACLDLIPGLERALEHVPGAATMSTYLGNQPRGERSMQAAQRYEDTSWVRLARLVWGVAMAAPVYTIDDMIRWTRTYDCPGYDTRVAMYYKVALGFPAWFTWPSLVTHDPGPSLLNHSDGREALGFIGEDASALKVDWGGRVVTRGARVPESLTGKPLPWGQVFVARQSFTPRINGVRCKVRKGVTRVPEGHPVLDDFPSMFERVGPGPLGATEKVTP